jgi:hypothetical protein
MQTELTANGVRGTAIGAIVAAGFGMGWLFWSLAGMQKVGAGSAVAVELGATALIVPAVYVARQAKRWPRVAGIPAMGRRFAWINAIQWAVVISVVLIFSKLRIDAYDASAVTAIVGLHYLPLARLFHFRLHYVTGAALVGWSAASALLFDHGTLTGATALGTGVILWTSAAAMLVPLMRRMTAETGTGVELQ